MNSKIYKTLKSVFGYDEFRDGQLDIIEAILSGQDVCGIMPTGAGKSMCYQLPALLMPGVTVVVSPLISLMIDQVKALNEAGVHAAYINSSLSDNQVSKALCNAACGMYKIVYVAPERLETNRFFEFVMNADISMITVDEAHCISQWGQDFRPSYLKIVNLIDMLPKRPVVTAFTATATEQVKNDIVRILKLHRPKMVVTGFDRSNLYFDVKQSSHKDADTLAFVREHEGESGIIYCSTRKNVDKVCNMLVANGIAAAKYHAGMTNAQRLANQESFIYDEKPVIVATNAFGMGIDKSNVRYVLHYNMPQCVENYYQEAGRAGRDGEDAYCLLLFSVQDIIINKFLIKNKEGNDELTDDEQVELLKADYRRLKKMELYSTGGGCYRDYMLEYFGEHRERRGCDGCGNCTGHWINADVDDTIQSAGTYGEDYRRYGGRRDTDAVYGSRYGGEDAYGSRYGGEDAYGSRYGGEDVYGSRYGGRRDTDAVYGSRYGGEDAYGSRYGGEDAYGSRYGGEDAYGSRYGGEEAYGGRYGDESVKGKRRYGATDYGTRSTAKASSKLSNLSQDEQLLFDELRQLRLTIARDEHMPPYIIFSDKTLADMCVKKPNNRNSMLNCTGVGETKYERFGQRFLEVIKKHF